MVEMPKDELRMELSQDEALLWSGQPRQGLLLRTSDALLIPFSLFWAGFAFVWEGMAIWSGPLLFKVWGIPFVLVGIYILIGRFFVDAWARKGTYYAVTSHRVLIVTTMFNRSVKSLQLKTLTDVTLETSSSGNGSGTISFGTSPSPFPGIRGMYWPGMSRYLPPAFELIDDAKRVHDMLRRAQQS